MIYVKINQRDTKWWETFMVYRVQYYCLVNGDWQESGGIVELDFLPIKGDVLRVFNYDYKVVMVISEGPVLEVYID